MVAESGVWNPLPTFLYALVILLWMELQLQEEQQTNGDLLSLVSDWWQVHQPFQPSCLQIGKKHSASARFPLGLSDWMASLCPASPSFAGWARWTCSMSGSSPGREVNWCPMSSAQLTRWAEPPGMIIYLASFQTQVSLPTCTCELIQSIQAAGSHIQKVKLTAQQKS